MHQAMILVGAFCLDSLKKCELGACIKVEVSREAACIDEVTVSTEDQAKVGRNPKGEQG